MEKEELIKFESEIAELFNLGKHKEIDRPDNISSLMFFFGTPFNKH